MREWQSDSYNDGDKMRIRVSVAEEPGYIANGS